MNDLQRFFKSIGYSSDAFNEASITKVNLKKQTETFSVYIKNPFVIDLHEINNLFLCASRGINNEKKCNVFLTFDHINDSDIINVLNYLIDEIIIRKPSLIGLKNSDVKIVSDTIYLSVISEFEKKDLEEEKKELINNLKRYGMGNLKIEIEINTGMKEQIKSEIEKDKKEVIIPKESPIVFGTHKDGNITSLNNILGETKNIIIEVFIFDKEVIERNGKKGPFYIINLKVSDKTDSYLVKIVKFTEEEYKNIDKKTKVNKWYRIHGHAELDSYTKQMVFNARNMEEIPSKDIPISDDAENKRVELHAHTMMSQMDGLTKLDLGKHTCELVENAINMGYKGVAITDHNGCQAFPIAYSIIKDHNKKIDDPKKHFKGLYGVELTLVDDKVNIVVNPNDLELEHTCYVVFDTETTGFNAGSVDQMIEIGAVKIKDGAIIDRFDEFIDPKRHIPDRITSLTMISDDMVKGADDEGVVTQKFLDWAQDLPLVAHNAKFDISFVKMAMKKYNLGEFKNTVIDTLELSRALEPDKKKHSLSALVKRYNVPWNEEEHHRADYDAEGIALILYKMLKSALAMGCKTINDLNNLIKPEEIYKFGRTYHFNAIAQNKKGLKNIFRMISLANTTYLYKTPRIPRSKIEELRDGVLIGSGCYESEVFVEARSKSEEEVKDIINFYDYVEVQPPEVYSHLIQLGDFINEAELENHLKKIIKVVKSTDKIIVATGDVHHFKREDKIYREIIVNQKVPGGGMHPLAKKGIKEIPSQHFRTTKEMLEDFSFLGDDKLAYEIVVTNTNKILDMVSEIEVIIDTHGSPFSPRVKSDDCKSYLDCPRVVTDLVYNRASLWYGEPLPYNIEERIALELYGSIVKKACEYFVKKDFPDINPDEYEKKVYELLHENIIKGFSNVKELITNYLKNNWDSEEELNDQNLEKKVKDELGGVIGGGFDPICLIAQRLVKHSNDEGFLVGSRGSVGSSFVATMMGITEVNPLPAHYRCKKCKHSIFTFDDGRSLGEEYSTGFDLPDKICPVCGEKMYKDGQDMPFATFLGFNADKVPDIDLNFSDLNQASAHAYTKVLFGADNVYRAGTIGTVAEKTAYGFVKGYCEDKNIAMNSLEVERLAMGCTGVKRTTGQHPGGIVVIPDYMEVFDFTPYQYPAEDPTSAWKTTHFDYHAIDECVLKLDILGHSDPTQLRLIQDITKTDISEVPLDDKETMSIFTSTKALGVTNDEIMCKTGTLGIPEFGTPFTIGMVYETKPTTFAELVKISGLSHGTDVWLGNAQELIKNNVVPFKDVIGCRDDIMIYLMHHGVKPVKAFKIMEFVRKGKASKDPEKWLEHKKTMEENNIPDWFISSCGKIKYMFPKAHAAAYVISAFRIAWYKVHMPVAFYASWLSCKATDFDIHVMIRGYDAIKEKIIEIQNKGYDATNKELGQLECLKVCLEASARGIKFAGIDLYKSEATSWKAEGDDTIYAPFSAVDGLGASVALKIVEERAKKKFFCVDDFVMRSKVNKTTMEVLRGLGVFDGMRESAQLSLFD